MSVPSESEMDRAMRKWKMLFEFLDLDGDGFLKLEEFMEFPTQLIKVGKVDLGSHLAKVYKSHWDKVCQAVNLPPGQQKIGGDLWIKGFHVVNQSKWFQSNFVPTMSKAFFDSMDKNGNNLISLEEWREHYNLMGANDEEFIRQSFAKMDENGDGEISREEFDHAFWSFSNYHGPDKDFSFLYNKFK
ncbi:clytin-like [Liolophura sinensis]|uniref:clytin-like n=1 Tax=Liolophura sinensis TaxID=3198878 RepID=UPI00315951A1